jgi:hypothetical protein
VRTAGAHSAAAFAVRGLLGVAFACTLGHDARAAWPPAQGANLADPSNQPNDPEYSGLWNFFSYLPAQSPGAPPYLAADTALGASGMSIDLAWEYGVGSQYVRIAIIDSGIQWEELDLVDQAWLNPGELTGAHMPQNSKGEPCGGAGALAGYDCNGDGVFSVADYAEDPRVTPIVHGDPCQNPGNVMMMQPYRMAGDLNHNCVLDPGDIIELFSDGVDDDANGYTDDIAGWDFFKDDNNPYDDVRDGHGTLVALEANAQGNNHLDGIGVCPGCRFVMLRAGESAVVDSNAVAKALVYATDNKAVYDGASGANVATIAGDAVNLTAFGRAAIDYAYANGVPVVASIGDANSRQHALPATYGHTLTVHAIDFDGPDAGASSTFLDEVNCSNFGGQLALSASATGCSDEAAARTAGVIGLIESDALGMTPPLTAEEAMQLAKMTADLIDVPASSSGPVFYESLPGFSQRFGYGRVNAAAAVRAVQAGQIPPEVEITFPAWFQTLYAGRTAAPVPVLGRVVAPRAPSYDFTVEWAPGVEPLDADFSPLADTVTDVPGQTVSGGDTVPLALLDLSSLDTAHPADPDSPQHENDRTITVRVQAVAHYASGDVRGEARRSLAVVNEANGLDTTLLPGFPLQLSGSVEAGAKLADITGDGVRDIVVGTNDGMLHVITVTGAAPSEASGFPYALRPVDGLDPASPLPALPSYLGGANTAYSTANSGGISPAVTLESIDGAPAIGDLFADGAPEIVFVSWAGTVYVVDDHGDDAPGWPVRLPLVPSCPDDPDVPAPAGDCMDQEHAQSRGAYASPVLADFDGDGKLDIVIAAFDGNVYVFHPDGTLLSGFPVRVHSPDAWRFDRIMSTPAVADFNGDGVPDILVGTNETVGYEGGVGFYFIVDGRGTAAPKGPYLPHWPVRIPSTYLGSVLGAGTTASPIAIPLEGDRLPGALLQGNGSGPLLLPADPGPQTGDAPPASQLPVGQGFAAQGQFGPLTSATPDMMYPQLSHPSVGDLDQDGVLDVVMSGGSQSLATNLASKTAVPFQQLLAAWSVKTGAMLPTSPTVIEDYTLMGGQAIADISGDGYPEVILGTAGYFVHALDGCGHEPPGWPKFTGGWVMATPAVGDVTGDHMLEVVVGTRDGYLYAWTTAGTDTGVIDWESFHHDNANTGSYATALDQGRSGPPTSPLALVCVPASADGGSAASSSGAHGSSTGGCHCSVGRGRRASDTPAIVACTALAALMHRRRRRRRALSSAAAASA